MIREDNNLEQGLSYSDLTNFCREFDHLTLSCISVGTSNVTFSSKFSLE
jgi:hypothetical protein